MKIHVVATLLLGVAILAAAVTGFVFALQIESPDACFEACFLDQLVPATFAFIFGVSALINLAMLPSMIAGRTMLNRLLIAQGALPLAALLWLCGLAFEFPVGVVFGALGVAAGSVVVCVHEGIAISHGRIASAPVS
jgi:hypothetical protein